MIGVTGLEDLQALTHVEEFSWMDTEHVPQVNECGYFTYDLHFFVIHLFIHIFLM